MAVTPPAPGLPGQVTGCLVRAVTRARLAAGVGGAGSCGPWGDLCLRAGHESAVQLLRLTLICALGACVLFHETGLSVPKISISTCTDEYRSVMNLQCLKINTALLFTAALLFPKRIK